MSEPGWPGRISFWYGLISLFTSILHNIYLLYHVEMFLHVYKIDKTSFWIGETVFMIWNSMNDPLFGWISDRVRLRTERSKEAKLGEESGAAVLQERLRVISIVGPLFALSFFSFWMPWGPAALQFVCCLCVYDGCLTAIDLHHSALLADLAITTAHRAQMSSYQSFFSAVGSVSVFLSYTVWDRSNTNSFLYFAAVLTAFSTVGYLVSTRALSSRCRIAKLHSIDFKGQQDATTVHRDGDLSSARLFLKQLLTHRNFFLFTAVNLVQVFHCHFNSNFFPAFLKALLGDSLTTKQASLLLGVSFVAPHVNNMLFLQLCKRWGLHAVIRLLLYVKLSLAAVMWLAGPQQVWLLCLFVASNRIFTEGTCKLLHLAVSDLVDEDCARHGRRQPVAALMYGMANFLAKPGQTVAPLVGTLLLSAMTGHDVFQTQAAGDQPVPYQGAGSSAFEDSDAYKQACYRLVVFLPMACGLLQIAAWTRYNLFGLRLVQVKSYRARFCLTTEV